MNTIRRKKKKVRKLAAKMNRKVLRKIKVNEILLMERRKKIKNQQKKIVKSKKVVNQIVDRKKIIHWHLNLKN